MVSDKLRSRSNPIGCHCTRLTRTAFVHAPPAPSASGSPNLDTSCTSADVCSSMHPENILVWLMVNGGGNQDTRGTFVATEVLLHCCSVELHMGDVGNHSLSYHKRSDLDTARFSTHSQIQHLSEASLKVRGHGCMVLRHRKRKASCCLFYCALEATVIPP